LGYYNGASGFFSSTKDFILMFVVYYGFDSIGFSILFIFFIFYNISCILFGTAGVTTVLSMTSSIGFIYVGGCTGISIT
jgi:hypothetical protein